MKNNLMKAINALKTPAVEVLPPCPPTIEKEEDPIPNKIYNSQISWNQIHENESELKDQIRTERKAQGLSQRALAIKIGSSQGTITRAECNGCVSITTIYKIAAGLGKKLTLS
jgi:ribosome-binding protein aMBF1 (putative translation factor)